MPSPDATALLTAVGLLIGSSALLGILVVRLNSVLVDTRAIEEASLRGSGLETRRYETAIQDRRHRAQLTQRALQCCSMAMLSLSLALAITLLASLTSLRPAPLVAPLVVLGLIAIAAGLVLFLREVHLAVHQHPRRSCGVDGRQRPLLKQS